VAKTPFLLLPKNIPDNKYENYEHFENSPPKIKKFENFSYPFLFIYEEKDIKNVQPQKRLCFSNVKNIFKKNKNVKKSRIKLTVKKKI